MSLRISKYYLTTVKRRKECPVAVPFILLFSSVLDLTLILDLEPDAQVPRDSFPMRVLGQSHFLGGFAADVAFAHRG
jgi:hypothetical protein